MSYQIAGRAIKNEYLALGTFAVTIGAVMGLKGGDKKVDAKTPVPVAQDTSISAESKDELDFIRQFVAEHEGDEKKH